MESESTDPVVTALLFSCRVFLAELSPMVTNENARERERERERARATHIRWLSHLEQENQRPPIRVGAAGAGVDDLDELYGDEETFQNGSQSRAHSHPAVRERARFGSPMNRGAVYQHRVAVATTTAHTIESQRGSGLGAMRVPGLADG